MAYEKWQREKYLQLQKLVDKKATPGDMAVTMKIDKKDLYYRLKLLDAKTNIQTWTKEELELLETSKNIDEYLTKCLETFGKHRDRNIFIQHWMNRDYYLAAWFKEKNERKKVHEIEIKNKVITEPIKGNGKIDSLPDIGEQMSTLINQEKLNGEILTAILTAITKQGVVQVALLEETLRVQKDTYALFKGKLETVKKPQEGIDDATTGR